MKKSDLKSDMVVETRKGELYLVGGHFITRETRFEFLLNYDDNMLNANHRDLDIMKVYEFNNAARFKILFDREDLTLLWERKEHNLTKREVEVLKELQTLGYEWLARDEDDKLFAYIPKPHKLNTIWRSSIVFNNLTRVDEDLFTFIKWEDKEPTNIKELLK